MFAVTSFHRLFLDHCLPDFDCWHSGSPYHYCCTSGLVDFHLGRRCCWRHRRTLPSRRLAHSPLRHSSPLLLDNLPESAARRQFAPPLTDCSLPSLAKIVANPVDQASVVCLENHLEKVISDPGSEALVIWAFVCLSLARSASYCCYSLPTFAIRDCLGFGAGSSTASTASPS